MRDETLFPVELMQCIGFEKALSLNPEGGAEVSFQARAAFAHSNGTVVQGGIVTAWLDCAMAWAVYARDRDRAVASLDINVSFLARVGVAPHVVQARVVKWGRNVVFLEAELSDLGGKCLARATSTGLLVETKGA